MEDYGFFVKVCSCEDTAASSYPSPFRSVGFAQEVSAALQYYIGLTLLLPLRLEMERCCIATTNYITTTSFLYLCSAFSKAPIKFGIFKKRGLCLDGYPHGGSRVEAVRVVRRWPSLWEEVGRRRPVISIKQISSMLLKF